MLVVDDDRATADRYTEWLEGHHSVRRAYGGREVLDALDDAVDMVFLDREMPRFDGEAVVEVIVDRAVDPRTLIVTAVDPRVDILELPVDDYLVKPVPRTDLLEAVTAMLERETYEHTRQAYFSLAAKKALLESEMPPAQLSTSDASQRIGARLEELSERADVAVDGFEDEFEPVLNEVTAGLETTGRW